MARRTFPRPAHTPVRRRLRLSRFLPRQRGGVYNLGELHGGAIMTDLLRKLWLQEEGQDIAEYAVMLAVILVLVVGTIRLIGGSANNVFSSTASSIGQ
jgi:Flp pilus assembly pilin Flp